MNETQLRMQELIRRLNEASDAYYNNRDEIISNYEWDQLFDELSTLEAQTGIILPDSPTQKAGADEDFAAGNREQHEYPALSLAKSKDVSVLQRWAGERPIWLSWKLDGITLVATYDSGKLTRLMTRGNGSFGTNITYLAPFISAPYILSSNADIGIRVKQAERFKLNALFTVVTGKRSAADQNIQALRGDGFSKRLFILILAEVGEKVVDEKLRLTGLVAELHGNLSSDQRRLLEAYRDRRADARAGLHRAL